MRILVIRNEPPWPLCYGGRLHGYELCRRLAARHDLLLLAEQAGETDWPGDVACRVGSKKVAAGSDSLPKLDRYESFFGVDGGFVRTVEQTVNDWHPDVVIGMSYRSLSCLSRIKSVPTIWDLQDDEVLHRLRELRRGRLTSKRADLKTLLATLLYQRGHVHAVSAVTVVSEIDRRSFRRWTRHPRVLCLPHGVDCRHYRPVEAAVDEQRIIFWGGLTFGPNISAVLHFAEKVWPLVKARHPGLIWSIVGWGKPDQLEHLRSVPGIEFTGYVDDIRPHVAGAAVCVVPMVSGSGIKNKIMEAWAMAKPVLCTPCALGDLPGRHGENVWLARTPHALAHGLSVLLADAGLRERMGRAARRTAMESCSWDHAATRLENLCRELIVTRMGRASAAVAVPDSDRTSERQESCATSQASEEAMTHGAS